jgi:S1-C subfamily serine protease
MVSPNRYGLPDFGDLVEQVGPAVVNISVVQRAAQGTTGEDPFANDPFYDFLRRFGVPMPGFPGQPGMGPRARQGIGSGFIVSPDGYVLTNAHVVAGEDGDAALSEVTVTLIDKREFKAKVVGIDRRTDVALLKIDAKPACPSVKIGNPDQARVGEWVVAMGSPFGFDNTVTAGIISAKARRLPDETYVPFIQTDVAINPGNSGGPLFNLAGEVVGINSQIYSRSGGFMGISFAIPIDVAMNIKDQLVRSTAACSAGAWASPSRASTRIWPSPSASTTRAARWSPASSRAAPPTRPACRRATWCSGRWPPHRRLRRAAADHRREAPRHAGPPGRSGATAAAATSTPRSTSSRPRPWPRRAGSAQPGGERLGEQARPQRARAHRPGGARLSCAAGWWSKAPTAPRPAPACSAATSSWRSTTSR